MNIFDTVFLPIVNALQANLEKRCGMYTVLDARFSFLMNLKKMSNEEIATACKNVATIYACDIDKSELTEECQLAKTFFSSERFSNLSFQSMCNALFEDKLVSTFPNLEILLRIYLCQFVTNVSGERSFSKMKLIKNYLRNSMTDDRLNSLAILAIESDVLDELNFDDIIETFVNAKRRKIPI